MGSLGRSAQRKGPLLRPLTLLILRSQPLLWSSFQEQASFPWVLRVPPRPGRPLLSRCVRGQAPASLPAGARPASARSLLGASVMQGPERSAGSWTPGSGVDSPETLPVVTPFLSFPVLSFHIPTRRPWGLVSSKFLPTFPEPQRGRPCRAWSDCSPESAVLLAGSLVPSGSRASRKPCWEGPATGLLRLLCQPL